MKSSSDVLSSDLYDTDTCIEGTPEPRSDIVTLLSDGDSPLPLQIDDVLHLGVCVTPHHFHYPLSCLDGGHWLWP